MRRRRESGARLDPLRITHKPTLSAIGMITDMAERVLTRSELNRACWRASFCSSAGSCRCRMPSSSWRGCRRSTRRLRTWRSSRAWRPSSAITSPPALERRQLVKALLMRGTLHIVTPRDYWSFTTGRRALGAGYWPPSYARRIPKRKLAELAKHIVTELRSGPQTFTEVRASIEAHATGDITPTLIWRRLQGLEPIVHVPPSGTWGYHGDGVYEAADVALAGEAPEPELACAQLIQRYLGAFGPASVKDLARWAGLQRLGPIGKAIARLDLVAYADEGGRTLFDLPGAPLPDPDTPAPPRPVPRYDNLVLAHADRARVLGDVPVKRIVMNNALVHATLLVDGFVAGIWQLEKGRVKLEPFTPLSRAAEVSLREVAERVEAFVGPP